MIVWMIASRQSMSLVFWWDGSWKQFFSRCILCSHVRDARHYTTLLAQVFLYLSHMFENVPFSSRSTAGGTGGELGRRHRFAGELERELASARLRGTTAYALVPSVRHAKGVGELLAPAAAAANSDAVSSVGWSKRLFGVTEDGRFVLTGCLPDISGNMCVLLF